MSTENEPSKKSAPLINLNLSFDAELRYKNKKDKLEPAKPVPIVHKLIKNVNLDNMGKTQSKPNKNTPDFVLPDLPPIRLDHRPSGDVSPQNPSFRPIIPKTKKQLPVKMRNNHFQQPVNLAQLHRRYTNQNSNQPEMETFDALQYFDRRHLTEGRTKAHLLDKWSGSCTLEELFGMLAKREVLEGVISDERTRMELEKKGIQEKIVNKNQKSLDEKNPSAIKVNAKNLKSQAKSQAKRPLNSYMLFAKLNRQKFKEKWPGKDNKTITSDLGVAWKALGLEEQYKCEWIVDYEELAEKIKLMHGQYFPDYQYDPKRKKKEELKRTLDSPNLPIKTKIPKVRQENSYRTSKKLNFSTIFTLLTLLTHDFKSGT